MTDSSNTEETRHATLVRPPPLDHSKAPIENVLELTALDVIGPEIYTNTRPLWHPPGARGIYGGAVIAQCLSAAQRTVPPDFLIHSMHAYFVLAGDSAIPILYHVEDVRSGRSFATRTVQARQKGKAIFTTTLSFVRRGSGGEKTVRHEVDPPEGLQWPEEEESSGVRGRDGGSPFETCRMQIVSSSPSSSPSTPQSRRTHQFIRAKGPISTTGGVQAHLSALAYMSDSYFIGTVARVHGLSRGTGQKFSTGSAVADPDTDIPPPEVGMMVSLDHTIYFHNPEALRADRWMFTEMESPWAGEGRGLVTQRVWGADGRLVASCVQEGVVRLKQDGGQKKGKGAKL